MANRLVSFVILAMLIFVPTSLRAQNSPPAPEVMNKLVRIVVQNGLELDVPSQFSNALGLSPRGQTFHCISLAVMGSDKTQSNLAIMSERDETVLVSKRQLNTLSMWRIQRDGKVLSALVAEMTSPLSITMRTPAEAQPEVNAVLKYWAVNSDLIMLRSGTEKRPKP